MRRPLLLAIAVVVLLAGCGGDDPDDLSRSEVIKRGDELCRGYSERSRAVTRRIEGSTDPREVAGALRRLTTEAGRVGDELDELASRAPESDRAELRRYVKGSREQITLLRRAADLYEMRKTARARTVIGSGQRTAVEGRRIVRRYGFKVCGSGRT